MTCLQMSSSNSLSFSFSAAAILSTFKIKHGTVISCQVKKYDLYSAAINSATVYMYVCVQKGQHHSGP